MRAMQHATDYLVIGAGASGLAFADELLTRDPTAHITLVDKRDAAGGHWNDVYPFVRLHQPATFYGVESRELARDEIDRDGPTAAACRCPKGRRSCSAFMRCCASACCRRAASPSCRCARSRPTARCTTCCRGSGSAGKCGARWWTRAGTPTPSRSRTRARSRSLRA